MTLGSNLDTLDLLRSSANVLKPGECESSVSCGKGLEILTRSRGGPGHRTLRWTRAGKQAGKALRSQGHHHARVM